MLVQKKTLGQIFNLGIVWLSFGYLLNKIILFYTGITSIWTLVFVILSGLTIFLELKKPLFRLTKADVVFSTFVLFVIVRLLLSENYLQYFYLQNFIFFVVLPYFLGRLVVRNFDLDLHVFLYPLLFVVSTLVIIEFVKNPDLLYVDRIRLFEHTTSNEVAGATQHFAGILFGAAASIAFLRLVNMFSENGQDHGKNAILDSIVLFISFLGLLMVSSKAALVAAVIVSFITLSRLDNFLKFMQLIFITGLMLGVTLTFVSEERMVFFSDLASIDFLNINLDEFCFTGADGGSSLTRLQMIYDSLIIWTDNPLLGAGPGQFGSLDCDNSSVVSHPHNIVFHVLSELGVVGFILMTSLIFLVLKGARVANDTLRYTQFKTLFYVFLIQSFFIGTGYLSNFNLFFFLGTLVIKKNLVTESINRRT